MTKTKKMFLGVILFCASVMLYAQSQDTKCLATAIYFESHGESLEGQYLVGETVLNRIRAGVASTICEAIYQHVGNHWQFGFNKGGKKTLPASQREQFYKVAQEVIDGNDSIDLPLEVQYFNYIPFPQEKYVLYRKVGHQYFYSRRQKYNSPLKGTREILIHQNTMADEEGLPRIKDETELIQMEKSGELVKLPISIELSVSRSLPENQRYCREWTAEFLRNISKDFNQEFGHSLQVNSAVRTEQIQKKLRRHNSNAAAIEGEAASPHLTGQAIDIAKKNLSKKELVWMRNYLLNIRDTGTIDVEEEFHQSVFHISVYHSYIQNDSTT